MKGDKLIDDHVQISVNLVRLKSHGRTFEVAVDPDKAIAYKEGDHVDIEDIVQSEKVFADMKKGLLASEEALQTVFDTTHALTAIRQILDKGELQLTQKHREEIRERKFNKIVNIIHRNAILTTSNSIYIII